MRTLILSLFLAAFAVALQGDTVSIRREFKVGEKDNFNLTVSAGTQMGDLDISLKMSQEVIKVSETGEVSLRNTSSDRILKFNGQEINSEDNAPRITTVVLTKDGLPKRSDGAGSRGLNLGFLQLANLLVNKDLKLGVETPVEFRDTDDAKNFVKGSFKLESSENGVAKVIAKLDVSNETTTKPMKVVMTALMDTGIGKANKVEGTVSDLPSADGIEIKAIQFVMERVK